MMLPYTTPQATFAALNGEAIRASGGLRLMGSWMPCSSGGRSGGIVNCTISTGKIYAGKIFKSFFIFTIKGARLKGGCMVQGSTADNYFLDQGSICDLLQRQLAKMRWSKIKQMAKVASASPQVQKVFYKKKIC